MDYQKQEVFQFNQHQASISNFTNSSNKNAVSTGPREASGWNCTPMNGFVRWQMPSLVPSLALQNHGCQYGEF